MYGSGYSAGCRLASIGCASGSCRVAAPLVEGSPVCIELYYRWCNRWFRSGLAADCGGVVCAADGVPADRWMIFLRHGNMENCRSCRWKSHSQPDGKRQAFSHKSANSFPTASQSWQFTHIPTTPTTAKFASLIEIEPLSC